MSMNILDFIETWWISVRPIVEANGVVARFERSPKDRLNRSCNLNFRRDQREEVDLIVWESGDAELGVVDADGSVSQKHFDDIQNQKDLSSALSRLAGLASSGV